MKTILTLDYELFFGKNVGSPQVSIIECTNKLLSVLNKFNAKAVFFVDVTYLLRLKAFKNNYVELQKDYDDVIQHIKYLEHEGHQIQLHIHPHWNDSSYDESGWAMEHKRYKLASWRQQDAATIIDECVRELNSHLERPVFAYRAGGWCLEPFSHIEQAFKNNDIWLDSTVFKNGRSLSSTHAFDFSSAPNLTYWRFETDPCIEKKNGYFTEIPIASCKVSPIFYWRLALTKKFGNKENHSLLGDGHGISSSKKDMLRMLTRFSYTVVSVDGFKSSLLVKAYKKANKRNDKYFVVIGHPKLLTTFSLINIEKWLKVLTQNGSNLSLYDSNLRLVAPN